MVLSDQRGSQKRVSNLLQVTANPVPCRTQAHRHPQPGSAWGPVSVGALKPRNVLLASHFCLPPMASLRLAHRTPQLSLDNPRGSNSLAWASPQPLASPSRCVPQSGRRSQERQVVSHPGLRNSPASLFCPPATSPPWAPTPARPLPSTSRGRKPGRRARKCLRGRATVGSTVDGWTRRGVLPVGASPGGWAIGASPPVASGGLPSASAQSLGCAPSRGAGGWRA